MPQPQPASRTPAAVVASVNVRSPLLMNRRLPSGLIWRDVDVGVEPVEQAVAVHVTHGKAHVGAAGVTPIAGVPSVNVPSPLFQNMRLV